MPNRPTPKPLPPQNNRQKKGLHHLYYSLFKSTLLNRLLHRLRQLTRIGFALRLTQKSKSRRGQSKVIKLPNQIWL